MQWDSQITNGLLTEMIDNAVDMVDCMDSMYGLNADRLTADGLTN